MKTEKTNSVCRFFGIFLVLLYTLLMITRSDELVNSDASFLWNRMCQVVDCFKDGIYPFLYYNDFEKVGYGSSIFYGQLTLLPFIPLALQGESQFISSYFMSACFLNYFGACSLAKRFTKHCDVVGFLYLSSPLMFMLLLCTQLYPCYLGVGLGLFFLASCVDIFRDNRPCYLGVLFFILLFNTHLITTVVCFAICVFICIYYFDKTRLKSYFKFFCLSVAISLYNIFNYIIHIKSLRGEKSYFDFYNEKYGVFVLSKFPFKDLIFYEFPSNTLFLGTLVLLCWIFVFFKCKSKKERFVHIVLFLSIVVGVKPLWSLLCSHCNIFIQFPIRYLPFTAVFILILVLRRFKSLFLVCSLVFISLVSVCVSSLTVSPQESSTLTYEGNDSFTYIGNGEYLSKNFIFNYDIFKKYSSTVIGDDNSTYKYNLDKNKVIIDLSNNTSKTVTVPKLYYNGYVAEDTSGNKFKCSEGYSMFTKVDVDGFNGKLQVYYKQPMYLVFLLIFDYLLGIVLISVILVKSQKFCLF